MIRQLLFITILLQIIACSPRFPKKAISNFTPPTAPDYSKKENWAALPTEKDQADRVPHPDLKDNQATAQADVFWLHPTSYTKNKRSAEWNASTNDATINKKTDDGSILNQASIFNGVGKIYAPRYRQAHLRAYYTKDTASAKMAFDMAYADIKSAFEYYLNAYNPINSETGKRRPIIIASHSQGTTHAGRLIREFFDGKKLQEDFVVAYLVGMPVPRDYFKNIKVCETPSETNCFCTWRTWKHGHFPKKHIRNNNIAVTNPLTWTTDPTPANKELNEGSVLRKFEKSFYENLVDAQVQDGILWAHKPKFPGSFLITFKNYHVADLNFYYLNVRKNAKLRLKTFLEKNQ